MTAVTTRQQTTDTPSKHNKPLNCTTGLQVTSASTKPQRKCKSSLRHVNSQPMTAVMTRQQMTDTLSKHNKPPNSTAGLHAIRALPSTIPRQKCKMSHNNNNISSKLAVYRSQQPLRFRIPPIAGMLRRHLDSFFAIAEVILKQNVDPG